MSGEEWFGVYCAIGFIVGLGFGHTLYWEDKHWTAYMFGALSPVVVLMWPFMVSDVITTLIDGKNHRPKHVIRCL